MTYTVEFSQFFFWNEMTWAFTPNTVLHQTCCTEQTSHQLQYASIFNNNDYDNNNHDEAYDAVTMESHCKSSPGSFDECRLSARWPPTLRPCQPTRLWVWLVGCYRPHPPSPFLIIQPKSWHSFYHPMEGWVDLGTAVRFAAHVHGCIL